MFPASPKIVGISSAIFLFATNVFAGVTINIVEEGTGVLVTVTSQAGTVSGTSSPGNILNFDNFKPRPGTVSTSIYAGSVSSSTESKDATAPVSLTLFSVSGTDANNSSTPYSVEMSAVRTQNDADVNEDDFDLDLKGSFSIQSGDTFKFDGSVFIADLPFSSFIPGRYASNDGDSASFGGVNLNIGAAAVPEATSFAIWAGIACVATRRRRR